LSGVPVEQLSGDDLRSVVGLVGQDAYLFDTTVADNLRVGRRDATDDQLHEVLDRVGLSGWLEELPAGLGTEVGTHGARLSGGQRQRLAVARAVLADFSVLVLDEPAEHLEPAAADALTADLLDVTDARSLVLITHRLAGLECVDEVIVMESGRAVQRGTHDELLGQAGRYSDLWWEEMRTERDARPPEEPAQHRQLSTTTVLDTVALNDGSLTS
jgi:ABC-type multidrug transport system fused ATPase/permease subunit